MKLKNILALLTLSAVSTGALAADTKTIEVGTGDKKNIEATVFNVTEIKLKPNQEVTIKFTNKSKTPGMQHNFVVTKPGKDKEVANASIAAGPDKGWVASTSDVLFKTKLLDAGKTDSVTIKFDQPGDYPFICTFPGHYPMMKGIIKVAK